MKKENWFKLAIIVILLWQVILLGKSLSLLEKIYEHGVEVEIVEHRSSDQGGTLKLKKPIPQLKLKRRPSQ